MNWSHSVNAQEGFELDARAYSREILSALRGGEDINVHVHVGATAWDRASFWGPGNRLVVPLDFDRSPDSYDFRFLAGQAVTVNAIDADLVLARRVVIAIVEQGAQFAVATGVIGDARSFTAFPATGFSVAASA
jgi:hypothetical protein